MWDRFLPTGPPECGKYPTTLLSPKDLLRRSGRGGCGHERRGPNDVQLRKTLFQIRVPQGTDLPLVRTVPVGGALPIAIVQLVYHFHAVGDHGEGGKSAFIEGLIIPIINEGMRS